MIEIFDSKGELPEKVIINIEEKYNIKLPDDFRNFLKLYNGGYPEPGVFESKDHTIGSRVQRFLGIHKEKYSNLIDYLSLYKGRISNKLFPIAHDSFGNLICIGIVGDIYGKIFFWNHEWEADSSLGEIPGFFNVTLIADNFDEFFEGLHE